MRRLAWIVLVAGCGAAAPARVVEPTTHDDTVAVEPRAPEPLRFTGHEALVLRTIAASPTAARRAESPPLYAELAADGSMTGTRCGATRFTDEGVLEREGVAVARVGRDGDAIAVQTGEGIALGWRIEGASLVAAGETRFAYEAGTIRPSDAELPAVSVAPATTPDTLALALFAALLVCDDVGP